MPLQPRVNAPPPARISSSDRDGERAIEARKQPHDQELLDTWIERARGGDAEAFDRLARHFLPRIRRWALVRTGDADDAEDVVQRTLVQAFRGIRSFKGSARISTWLYRIVANAAGEQERRRGARTRHLERYREQRRLEGGGEGRTAEDGIQGEGGDKGGELHALVASFLGELSERQRQMMDLVDLQGYTPIEAAHMLGIKADTARVHLLRARRHIRAKILEREPAVVEDSR